MGFGIFVANSVFGFEQYTSGLMTGWRTSRRGYLGEADLAYALAIFAELLDISTAAIKPHLTTNSRSYFTKARKHLVSERAAELRSLTEL